MGELRFDPNALSDTPKSDTTRIIDRIEWLWNNRTLVEHHPLRHELSGLYKRVLGKYRIIYGYDPKTDDMTVYLVGTRDSIYKDAIKKIRDA